MEGGIILIKIFVVTDGIKLTLEWWVVPNLVRRTKDKERFEGTTMLKLVRRTFDDCD